MGGEADPTKVESSKTKPDGDDKKPTDFNYSEWLKTQKDLPDETRAALADFDPAKSSSFKNAIDRQKADAKAAADRAEAAEKKLAEIAAEAEKKAADQLKAQNEFKTLYEQTEEKRVAAAQELTELKAQTADQGKRIETMEALLQKMLDSQKKDLDLPGHIDDLLNGKSVEEQLDWLTTHREGLTKATVTPPPKSPDEGRKSKAKPDDKGKDDVKVYDARRALR